MRAAYEEGKILWRREPIQEVLEREDLDPIRRAKFETVLGVREFAKEKLGLRVGGSYASYSHLDRPILSYLLTAVPKTKFEPYTWWFLFVGTVPYKGYFDRSDAEDEALKLEEDGYDTYIRPVGAFSTLGWFDDPVLEQLLQLNRVRLADVIFHELLHNTLFVKGSVNFNESLANFVGKRGAIEYFTDRYGSASPEARAAVRIWDDELGFSRFLMKWVECLKELYAEPISEPEKLRRRIMLFETMQTAWRKEISGQPDRFHTGFEEAKLNNAVLMQYYFYVNNLELFEKLYERTGRNLRQTIDEIEVATESGKAPFDALAELVDGTAVHAPPLRPVCPASESRSGL
jgi:predicted aminopeptidase